MGYANLSLDEISSGFDIIKYAIKNSKINNLKFILEYKMVLEKQKNLNF